MLESAVLGSFTCMATALEKGCSYRHKWETVASLIKRFTAVNKSVQIGMQRQVEA